MVSHMLSPEIWQTIAEAFLDILAALEKNERIGDNDQVVQVDREDCNSGTCDID